MPDTDVNLNINAKGGERAARSLDNVAQKAGTLERLAPAINRLGTGLAGLGQVARILGPQFDALGQSITMMGIAAQGLGAIGAIFGPLGQAIGTVAGIAVGAINLINQTSAEAEAQARARQGGQAGVQNNINIDVQISAETVEEMSRELDRVVREQFQRFTRAGIRGDMDEVTTVVARQRFQ
jgi:hypothetical protein